jgi:uncharacterized protein DUF6023
MLGERGRGAVLYACAGLVLAGGGVWWFRAAPREVADPQVEQWTRSAEQLLPDTGNQESAGTVALAAGADQQVLAEGGDGSFMVSVICVGGANSSLRISLSDTDDSGHGLSCTDTDPTPFQFKVSIPDELRMNVTVTDAGPVVFRYSLMRTED